MFRTLILVCLALAVLAGIACSSSGSGGRPVALAQNDDGCTPATIDATPGEKLDLQIKNNTGKDYEVEGIEGTQLEEVIIPGGRDRSVGYNVPGEGGTFKIKCYVPGGASTIIEVRAGEGAAASDAPGGSASPTEAVSADATVSVGLKEYQVIASAAAVNAGKIKFEATNNSTTQVHELAVLRVKDDGTFENMGEVEDIDPGSGGSVVIDLAAGRYQLACVIVPGEAGSTVDHYEQGMHIDFTVK
jgi:uncharacterized cupredoxin-like copper-binding protein